MSMQGTFISVILPLKIDWEPIYSLSDEDVSVGQRVCVLFSGKEYIGVVSQTGVTPDFDTSRILPIKSIEDGMPPILENEIKLWRQVARYYLCTVGEVYRAAYPSLKTGMEKASALSKEKARARQEAKAEKMHSQIEAAIEKLKTRLESKKIALESTKGEKTRQKLSLEIDKINQQLTQKEQELYSIDSKDDIKDAEETCISCDNTAVSFESPVLSDRQNEALTQINEGFREGKTVLLHGITGSGKTEIYITLALDSLRAGKNVLYLVPEIAISRQLEQRLEACFGESLMIFHSAQTNASKRDIASAIRDNASPYVLLGTRSSLFLPHHDLGLVIVDEEHENSYKQEDPAPRYNGRETAIMLAKMQGANSILGSATPSLESIYNCLSGRYRMVELLEKYHHAEDADIEIIDIVAERKKNGMVGSFSRKLIEKINIALSEGGQVIILRARRAYSPVLQCSECGEVVKCSRCSVPMSLHRYKDGTERLVCHYCGNVRHYTPSCHKCGSALKPLGAGTQKIEEELTALFPNARIARLDSDTAKSAGFEKKTIQQFSDGEIDILVGTQIVAKGFDFKGLSLAVALQADGILAQQDFRADEKAAQILSQLRGRCSRRDRKGLFVIQTAQGEHPVYTSLGEGTLQRSNELLNERNMFGFPPYSRIIGIILKDSNHARLEKLSRILSSRLSQETPGLVTGPYTPANEQLAGQWIMHIRVSLKKDRNLSSAKDMILKCVKQFEKDSSYMGHVSIDVDPI